MPGAKRDILVRKAVEKFKAGAIRAREEGRLGGSGTGTGAKKGAFSAVSKGGKGTKGRKYAAAGAKNTNVGVLCTCVNNVIVVCENFDPVRVNSSIV